MAELDSESCAELLSQQRYNPDILPRLEAFVDAQCSSGTYDLDCNLAVLKLYQFHPEKNNIDTVAKILVKALMQLPATDYLLCTYLIPERVVRACSVAAMAHTKRPLCRHHMKPSLNAYTPWVRLRCAARDRSRLEHCCSGCLAGDMRIQPSLAYGT